MAEIGNRTKLALLGGTPIRTKEFKSKPLVDDEEVDYVVGLMREGRFSKFVGSPIENTRHLLSQKSAELAFCGSDVSFLGGEYVRRFEAEWSKLIGADYCISVNSATSGITTALLAAGIEPGCEVITTPFTFTATGSAILLANAIPIFCDIDLETFCISPESLERNISPHTNAIMPVHWCGNAGNLDEIMGIARKYGLKVIEDAAQAPATIYQHRYLGTYGDAGIFSFNEPKNIMTGEGGIVATNNLRIAEKSRLIRNHGESIPTNDDDDEYVVNTVGYNFRLVEILAAIGCAQVKKLETLNSIRAENYKYLRHHIITSFGEFIIPQKITHEDSYFSYTAGFRWLSEKAGIHRNLFAQALRAEGIPVATGVSRLICDHPVFTRKLAFGKNHHPWNSAIYKGEVDYCSLALPNARKLHDEEYLGFFQMGWPNTKEDMDDILSAFKKIFDNKKSLLDLSNGDNDEVFISSR